MSIITSKFYATQAIDTIQNAKSTFLKNVVTDEKFRSPLQAFVDAQTNFAKEVVRVTDELIQQSYNAFEAATKTVTAKAK